MSSADIVTTAAIAYLRHQNTCGEEFRVHAEGALLECPGRCPLPRIHRRRPTRDLRQSPSQGRSWEFLRDSATSLITGPGSSDSGSHIP